MDFEDKGNTWEVPFETLGTFQFELGSTRADARDRARYEIIAERLNKPLAIACELNAWKSAVSDLLAAEQDALNWIRLRSTGSRAGVRADFSSTTGLDVLYRDTASYMSH